MFLPESNIRKYVRVVMGFFIITILLSPITAIFRQDFTEMQNIVPKKIINDNWDEIERRGREIEKSNERLLNDYYQKKVKKRISEVINLEYSDYQHDITVQLDEDYRIKSMKILLTEKNVNQIDINPVKISINDQKQEDDGGVQNSIESEKKYQEKELEYKLSQVFQIAVDKVSVNINAGG